MLHHNINQPFSFLAYVFFSSNIECSLTYFSCMDCEYPNQWIICIFSDSASVICVVLDAIWGTTAFGATRSCQIVSHSLLFHWNNRNWSFSCTDVSEVKRNFSNTVCELRDSLLTEGRTAIIGNMHRRDFAGSKWQFSFYKSTL